MTLSSWLSVAGIWNKPEVVYVPIRTWPREMGITGKRLALCDGTGLSLTLLVIVDRDRVTQGKAVKADQ